MVSVDLLFLSGQKWLNLNLASQTLDIGLFEHAPVKTWACFYQHFDITLEYSSVFIWHTFLAALLHSSSSFLFFLCSQLYLWGSPFWVRFLCM